MKVNQSKCAAFNHHVDVALIREGLGFPNKLPKDFEKTLRVELLPRANRWRNAEEQTTFGRHNVTIVRHTPILKRDGTPKNQATARIFIECACGKLIPAGRIAQHTHDTKYGTVMLKAL